MKLIPRSIPLLLAAMTLVHAENDLRLTPADVETAPAPLPTARILGEIPDGTPPPPTPPKPEYPVDARDILSTRIHEQGGRTVTIREIKPIDLPTPPPPKQVTAGESEIQFCESLEAYRETHQKNEFLSLGATVFRSNDSPTRTLVRWWPQGKRETITFWSSADFALVAGGIQTFVDELGTVHHVMMGWSHVDIDPLSDLNTARDWIGEIPDLPVFPEGDATFQLVGNIDLTAEEWTAIESLHDIYNREEQRLRTAYEGRERARIEREAFLKANPPQPKDITLNFWRTQKPTADGKGDSK